MKAMKRLARWSVDLLHAPIVWRKMEKALMSAERGIPSLKQGLRPAAYLRTWAALRMPREISQQAKQRVPAWASRL